MQSPGMKASDQKVTKTEQEGKCRLLTIASYHITTGALKRRTKTERLQRNFVSLKEFPKNLQHPPTLWTGHCAPPCAQKWHSCLQHQKQAAPSSTRPGLPPSGRTNCSLIGLIGALKYSRTAFGTSQDTVLDRHDFSNDYY